MDKPLKRSYLSVDEAADFLGLASQTLNNMRWKGTGPKYHKHGRKVFYHIDELKRWSGRNERGQTTFQYKKMAYEQG